MAKSKKKNSKKELEKEGRTLGVELDKRHNKEDLIEKVEVIAPEVVSNDATWNSIEEFTEAVTETGLLFNSEFIPVNIPALYEAYTSNPVEFKETAAYKFLTK